jgi:hypothetical protein
MRSKAFPVQRWHQLSEAEGVAEALVIVSCDPADVACAQAFAARSGRVVPRCAFAAFEAGHRAGRMVFTPVQEIVEREAHALGLALPQIVLIGAGRAGQYVLDLTLCNALPGVHVIVVDLPPGGVVISLPLAQGSFRFVQHRWPDDPEGYRFDHTIHALRDACLDIRTMVLPNDPGATERAIGTFLVELVARASRHRPARPRDRSVAFRIEDPA